MLSKQLFVQDDEWINASNEPLWIRNEISSHKEPIEVVQQHASSSKRAQKTTKENLVKQMTLVYSEYNAALTKSSAVSNKKTPSMIDISGLLPPGWTPKMDILTPQPPQWKIRPSKSRPVRKVDRSKQQAANPMNQGDSTTEESTLLTLQSNQDCGNDGESHAPVTDLESSKLATQRYNEAKNDAHKFLIQFISAAAYCKRLHSTFSAVFNRKVRASCAIQRWARGKLKEKSIRKFFRNMRWPLFIIVNIRVFRKNAAANKMLWFLREYARMATCIKLKQSMSKIRVAQEKIRGFVAICRARIRVLTIFWVKEEARVRKLLYQRDRKIALRLKYDAIKRMMDREKQQKGHYNIHTIWAQKKQAVQSLLSHCDIVQQNYRKNYESSREALRLNDSPPEDKNRTQNRPSDGTKGKQSRNEMESIAEDERESIIAKHIKAKRMLHVAILTREQIERKQPKVISEEVCRGLIQARTKAQTALALDAIDNVIFSKYSIGSAAADEEQPEKAAPVNAFLCLTDARLGSSWKKIVEESVKRDIESRKCDAPDSADSKGRAAAVF